MQCSAPFKSSFVHEFIAVVTHSLHGRWHGMQGKTRARLQRLWKPLLSWHLLGAGDIDKLFPESLDEAYAAYGADEMEWRVVL